MRQRGGERAVSGVRDDGRGPGKDGAVREVRDDFDGLVGTCER